MSNALLAGIGVIITFLFPFLLSVDEYAYYQEYTLYLSYINICHLGIASGMFLNYAGKEYSAIDKSQYKSEILLIFFVLLCFTFVGFGVYIAAGENIFLLVTLYIIPHCLIASFQALYQAWNRFTAYSVINALPKLFFVLVVVLLAFKLKTLSGNTISAIYVVIIWGIALYLILEFLFSVRGVRSQKIFSKKNAETTVCGFLITFGNYVNLLFHSIDKQFVNSLYTVKDFAIYSFAMTLQNVMMLFITAIANPFYPRLAKGDIDGNFIKQLKQMLLMFGAYSGCAYFIVSYIVKRYIESYVESLDIVAVFFAVFPAMAVINVIYINLYKIKRLVKKYILTLFEMLFVAIILNTVSVALNTGYMGICVATLIAYYIWLFYSQKEFQELTIGKRDCLYLLGFFILYFLSKIGKSDIFGLLMYTITITIWNLVIYKETFLNTMFLLLGKLHLDGVLNKR